MSSRELLLCECLGRDGLQSFPQPLATDRKVELLSDIIHAGFPKVEVTSFVPAKYIPQFADASEVLRRIPRPEGVRLVAFIPNERGAISAADLATEDIAPTDLLIVISASKTHNRRNLNRAREETVAQHKAIAAHALGADMALIGSIATSFGCPYTGTVPLDEVFLMIDHYLKLGVAEVQFGDTTGMANPLQVEELFRRVFDRYPDLPAIAHFHDVRGVAMANTLTAVQAGVTRIDCSIGGTGGRPHYQRLQESGPTGNLCSEDFVALADQMGFSTGVDPAKILEIGKRAESYLGEILFSHTVRSGLVDQLTQAEELKVAIKLGHSQSLVVPEDEIIERLLAIWSEAVSKGARPSPELYRQCVSDVLRSYVREKRESATAFMRRFSDTYTYDDMLPLFAADDEASNIVPREKEPVPEPKNFTEPAPPTTNAEEVPEVRQKIVTPQTLKIIHMRQRLRRRRTIGILLFILVAALFAWSGRILDAVPKVVSLDDIPDILQVYQSNSEHWPAGNQQLGRTLWGQPTAKVRVIESLYQSALSQQTWIIALKSAECMPFLRRLDDSKAAAWALRRAARELEYQLTGPVKSQKMSSVYAHYPVDILVARAPAYPTGNSEESGWLETGISALPEGIGAVGVVRTQYLTNSLAENSLMKNPKQVLRLIQGRAFFCRQPTLWGWYIDRDRYLP